MAMNKGTAVTPTAKKEEAPATVYDLEKLAPLTFLQQNPDIRMLITGDTGSGKTSQIGEIAEYLKMTTGKDTALFTMDRGGFLPLTPYAELGVIKVHAWDGEVNPWIWIRHALKGEAKIDGKWVKVVDPAKDALAAYEGLTAFSETLLAELGQHSADHPSQAVGGDSAWNYEVTQDGETIKMASNTMSHFGLVQLQIMREIWSASPGVPSLWTSLLGRASDPLGGSILGAQTVGNKQGPMVPRWFDFTFRLDARPQTNGPAIHTLYLETHMDQQSKGSKVIANARLPRAGQDMVVQAQIQPASVVQALLQIQGRYTAGVNEVKARLAKYLGK